MKQKRVLEDDFKVTTLSSIFKQEIFWREVVFFDKQIYYG